MTPTPPPRPGTTIASVQKALSILDLVVERRAAVGVTEASRALGYSFSTTHHLMATLRACGYLEQDPASRKYRLGISALRLGLVAGDGFDLCDRAAPVLRDLAQRVNENANLAVLDQGEVVYIQQAPSTRTSRMFTRLGARAPLYCTGVGKVFLAHLPPDRARACFDAAEKVRFTARTLTRWSDLCAELDRIRAAGWAADREEREEGVACLAAPVRDAGGELCAALSLSGPAGRILPRADELAPAVVAAATALSAQLGYLPPAGGGGHR